MWRDLQQNTASHRFYGMIRLIAPLKMSHFTGIARDIAKLDFASVR